MFEGQPKGLYALALANTGERFGYYTMLAISLSSCKRNSALQPPRRQQSLPVSWQECISCR